MTDRLGPSLTPYPGSQLTSEERARVDAFAIPLDELTVDHVLYSLGRFVETSFANAMLVAAEVVGEDAARRIAREAGRRHGAGGYAKLLAAAGTPGAGDAATMAQYQDLAHTLRGPKHASQPPAEVVEGRCVVRKAECGFYDATRPETAPFVGEFEAGCFEAYRAVDRELASVQIHACRWQGADRCEIEFAWSTTPAGTRSDPD
jgi:hypothetical protein